jgi:ATP-dependent Lon protease
MPSSKRDIKDKLKKLKKPPPLPPQSSESDSSEEDTIYVTDSSSSSIESSSFEEEIKSKNKKRHIIESCSDSNSNDIISETDESESSAEPKHKKLKKYYKSKKSHKNKKNKKSSIIYKSSTEDDTLKESSSEEDSDEDSKKKKKKQKNAYSLILSIGKDGDDDYFEDDDYDDFDEDDLDEDTEDEECNSDDEKNFMKENYQKIQIPVFPETISSKYSKNNKKDKEANDIKDSKKSKKTQSNESEKKEKDDNKDDKKNNDKEEKKNNDKEEDKSDNIESEYLSLIELKKDFIEKLKKNPKNKIIRQAIEGCDESIKTLVKSSRKKNTLQYRKLIKKENNKTDEFDYFKKKLSNKEQLTIMKDLEEINSHICIEKPYRLTLLQSNIPAKYKAIAMQKLNLLKMLVPGDPEYCKLKNWVDCFMKIPFGNYKNLSINLNDGIDVCSNFLQNAKETLDNCVYGLEDAKIQIMQMLGQWMSNPSSLGSAIAIKGPPGTGKCHTYNTPILMYDGTIKMVQDIKIGDVIMGDDSTPRNVLSLGSGMDLLYNVCLFNGIKFGVNAHHILCLIHPSGYKNEMMVKDYLEFYSKYGNMYNQYMPSEIISDNQKKTENISNQLDNLNICYSKSISEDGNTVTFYINNNISEFIIEPIGYGQYYGFELDGNHRYLLGNMYVTHNTSLVKEGISKILGREFTFIALGGASDSSFLEGHSYTYEGSSWGKIIQILIDSKCMNPVIYFDELDKISDTPKGQEIVGILTHLTDTSQNSEFHDKYFFEMEFDLSKCLFIFSYNNEELVNPILKDRMYRIQTKGYNSKDKVIIAKKYLLPKIRAQVNFNETDIIIPDDVIEYIINKQSLTKAEDGVRNLKRCLEIIYTKLNLFRLITPENQIFKKHIDIDVTFPFTVSRKHVDILIKPEENDLPKSLLTMYI